MVADEFRLRLRLLLSDGAEVGFCPGNSSFFFLGIGRFFTYFAEESGRFFCLAFVEIPRGRFTKGTRTLLEETATKVPVYIRAGLFLKLGLIGRHGTGGLWGGAGI